MIYVFCCIAETPVCDATSIGDVINITCSTKFRGERYWRPHFECGQIKGTQTIVFLNETERLQAMTASFSYPRDASNTTIVCSVKFNTHGADIEGTASNTPELQWSWTFTGIVYYKHCGIITATCNISLFDSLGLYR